MKKNKILYLVIPCYNEEDVLNETASRLIIKFNNLIIGNKISNKSKILFINDGSKDNTWSIIEKLNKENNIFMGISLSKNSGHQKALLAGLMEIKDQTDMVISMDADLQDDIDAIDLFIEKYYEGNEIVYGVRNSRRIDNFFKKNSALIFYKLMQIMGVEIVYNHADYRLMGHDSLVALEKYKEVNLFLRGIIPLLGFKSTIIYYERKERFAGTTKYPFKKMLSLALDGITSFTITPIKMIINLGMILTLFPLILMFVFFIFGMAGHSISLMYYFFCSLWLIGGLQILSIGIVGQYVGKTYQEIKARPRYIVEKRVGFDD